MIAVPLSTGYVVLDGAGAGTIQLAQVPPFKRWEITRVSLQISGGQASNLGGEARLYRGDALEANYIDGTETPWLDVFGGSIELVPPEYLRAEFTGCGAGQRATVTIAGVQYG